MKNMILGLFILAICPAFVWADKSRLETQFMLLDEDHNGVISQREVRHNPEIIRTMHLYGNNSFQEADNNADGVLDKSEFFAFEERLPTK